MTARQHSGPRPRALSAAGSGKGVAVLLFLAPTLVLLALTRLAPLGVTVNQAFAPQSWDVVAVLGDLFSTPRFVSSVTTTLWFALIINPLQILSALALAVLLSQRIPGRSVWRMLVFCPSPCHRPWPRWSGAWRCAHQTG